MNKHDRLILRKPDMLRDLFSMRAFQDKEEIRGRPAHLVARYYRTSRPDPAEADFLSHKHERAGELIAVCIRMLFGWCIVEIYRTGPREESQHIAPHPRAICDLETYEERLAFFDVQVQITNHKAEA